MEELYTQEEYAQKAAEANKNGQMLYILVSKKEYDIDVPDFVITQKTEDVPKLNANGDYLLDENGNMLYETVTVEVKTPVMTEKEVPVYDENGEQNGTQIIQVQQTHKETITKEVAELVVADTNYYICYKDNYTDGTLNPDYNTTKLERAKAQKLRENATALEKKDSLNTSLGVIKINTPIGRIDVVVTSMLNIVQITQHNLQAGFLRFYVDGAETPSPEMTPQQVGAFYLEIAQKLKDTDSLYKNYENLIKAAKSIEELEAITLDYTSI